MKDYKFFSTVSEAKKYAKKKHGNICFVRTEQWEITVYGYGLEGSSSSEEGAELELLRKYVKIIEEKLIEDQSSMLDA
jgi:hypothetical protein